VVISAGMMFDKGVSFLSGDARGWFSVLELGQESSECNPLNLCVV
jgi:hypothetical protein